MTEQQIHWIIGYLVMMAVALSLWFLVRYFYNRTVSISNKMSEPIWHFILYGLCVHAFWEWMGW